MKGYRVSISWVMLAALVFLVGSTMGACSLLGSGGSTPTAFDVCSGAQWLEAEQAAAVTAVGVVTTLHNAKQMTDANFQQAQLAYQALGSANDDAVSALVTINDAGGNSSAVTPQQWTMLAGNVVLSAAQFYAIYSAISQKAAPQAAKAMRATSSPTCTMTDTQLQALKMPPWPGATIASISGSAIAIIIIDQGDEAMPEQWQPFYTASAAL